MASEPILQTAFMSDTGLVRKHNEDTIATDPGLGILIVADGMGGYQAGEIASEIAATEILRELTAGLNEQNGSAAQNEKFNAAALLYQAILHANHSILQSAEENPAYHGMGTTVVSALFHKERVYIAHVGDSRLYRLRNDKLEQLTSDHSVLQELVNQGFYTVEEARRSPNRNLVTRALGVQAEVSIDIQENAVYADDLYLLCSDGLNDMLDDKTIQHIILHSGGGSLQQTAKNLIHAANQAGGHDNISVVLARPLQVKNRLSKTAWWKKLIFSS